MPQMVYGMAKQILKPLPPPVPRLTRPTTRQLNDEVVTPSGPTVPPYCTPFTVRSPGCEVSAEGVTQHFWYHVLVGRDPCMDLPAGGGGEGVVGRAQSAETRRCGGGVEGFGEEFGEGSGDGGGVGEGGE